jgi:hypothetical protein
MKATRPGPPPNGAISATLDIGCPHRLQARCAAIQWSRTFEVGPSVLLMRVNEQPATSFQFTCWSLEIVHGSYGRSSERPYPRMSRCEAGGRLARVNRITRSCAVSFVVAFAMGLLLPPILANAAIAASHVAA